MKLYKLIGDENNLFGYIKNHPITHKTDWSGTYFQNNIPHALTCYGYRIDQGYKLFNLIEFDVGDNIKIIELDDAFICDPKIPGIEKANFIKSKYQIDKNVFLCDWLHQQNSILKCLEFCDVFEYFVPINTHIIHNEKIIAQYKTNNKMDLIQL